MITAQSKFSEEELIRSIKLHYRTGYTHRLFIWLFRLIGVIVILCGILTLMGNQEYDSSPMFGVGIALLVVSFLNLTLWLRKRNIRKMPMLNKQVNWTIDDNGISGKGEGFEFSSVWPLIYLVAITKEGLLIYPQKQAFWWVPASAFQSSEEYEAAKTIIKTHVKSVKT